VAADQSSSPQPSTPVLLLAMVRLRALVSRSARIKASEIPQSPNPPIAISIPSLTIPSKAVGASCDSLLSFKDLAGFVAGAKAEDRARQTAARKQNEPASSTAITSHASAGICVNHAMEG
jgi:hypothetical protein